MITLEPADVLGHCIFCDEIRVENTGKFLYIGVYPAAMHIPSFPVVLPRLGIGITYAQRPSSFIAPVKFVVFLPSDPEDKPSITTEVPEQATKDALANREKVKSTSFEPQNMFATVRINLNFGMLPIAKAGLLKVRAVRGDTLFRLGTLVIETPQASAQNPISSVSQPPS
jgi:hypothetical protein